MTKEEILKELMICKDKARQLQDEFMKEPDKSKGLAYIKEIKQLAKRVTELTTLLDECDPTFKSEFKTKTKLSLKNLFKRGTC